MSGLYIRPDEPKGIARVDNPQRSNDNVENNTAKGQRPVDRTVRYESNQVPNRFNVPQVDRQIAVFLNKYGEILKSEKIENPKEFLENLLARLDNIVVPKDDLLPDESDNAEKKEQEEKQKEALIHYMFAVKRHYSLSFEEQLNYLENNYIPQEEYDQKFLTADLEIRYGMPVGQLKEHTAEILAKQPIIYTIKKGDTLNGIISAMEKERGLEISSGAKRKRVIEQICALNGIKDPDKINAGAKLQLPPVSTAEIKNKGLTVLLSENDLARIKLALDLPELPPIINELLEILSGVILLNYSPEMTDILEPRELIMQTILDPENINKNINKIKELIANSNDPELSEGERNKRAGDIIRNICQIGTLDDNKKTVKEKVSKIVSDSMMDQKDKEVQEAVGKVIASGNTNVLGGIDEISAEVDVYILDYKQATATGDGAAADEALRNYNNSLEKLRRIINDISANSSPEEREKAVQKVQDIVGKGLEAGLLTDAEAGDILAGIFANLLYAAGQAAEYVNFVTLDSQVQVNAANYDENCLVYMRKLLEDNSYIAQFIADKNAKEAEETKLLEKRKELASLNIPKSIRNLISQIYGIDFENIDGAVATTLAAKISSGKTPRLG
jgi:hypothetical protein